MGGDTEGYLSRVRAGLALVPAIEALAFGDLHLEHIRAWREEVFGDQTLRFPLWRRSAEDLLEALEASGARCTLSAIPDARLAHLRIGDVFDRAFIAALPVGVDAFGERGEFHTRMDF